MSLRSEVIRIFNELVGAGKKITELPAATTPLAGTELLEIVQAGTNRKITASNLSSGGTGVQSVVAGTNVTVDATDPQNPIVSASGGGGGGTWGSITGTLSDQTDLQTALDAKASTGSVSTVASDLAAHISDTTGAHAASAISNTPAGTIAAITVQEAIDELASEKQASSSDLTTIAGLTPSNDDFLQRKSGAWANRTVAQVKTDLNLSGTNTGDQTTVTGNAGTATALQTARKINQVSFDGTTDIKLNARSSKTANYSVVSTDSGTTIVANPTSSDITFTIDALAADDYISVLNKGTANVIFAAGTASISGLVSLSPGLTALIYYDLSNAVQIWGGNTGTSGSTVLNTQLTSAANTTTTEADLFTYTLAAGALSVGGESIEGVISGTMAANANGKTWRLYFGATAISTGSLTRNAEDWCIRFSILRNTGTTQKITYTFTSGVSGTAGVALTRYGTAAETLSGAIVVKVTAQATSTNDIVGQFWKIKKEGF